MDIREAIIYKNVFGGGGSGSVNSVNGQTGEVVLTASDVGALPDDTPIPSLDGYATENYVDGEINDVQSQIDAIVSRSDVVDVVGTYTELQSYDTSSLGENDVIKVLDDSTHNNQRSYYRWSNNAWVYVGSESVGYTKAETDVLLNGKQNTISDLATIRSGAALGATAVQPEAGKGLFSGNYNDLTNKPTIPSAVTESTVSGWGFTKNTGTYSKPSTGIPKTDLASAVQTSLGKADTALQEHQDISGKENTSNKVTTISSASTNTQYPSAKAVYDFIESLDGNGVTY